jgi:hypothetical protein
VKELSFFDMFSLVSVIPFLFEASMDSPAEGLSAVETVKGLEYICFGCVES